MKKKTTRRKATERGLAHNANRGLWLTLLMTQFNLDGPDILNVLLQKML